MGLKPHDRLLDAGCGAAAAFRRSLHPLPRCRGHYCGIDINPDFIRVARETSAQDPVLHNKSPKLEHVENFDFPRLDKRTFTYVLAFSVLNHCDVPMRRTFFEKITKVLSPESKIYLTHGHWWQDSLLNHTAARAEAVPLRRPAKSHRTWTCKSGAGRRRKASSQSWKYRHGPRSWTVGKSSKHQAQAAREAPKICAGIV